MSKFDRNRIKDGLAKLCTNKHTNRHYENNGHLAVNQKRGSGNTGRINEKWSLYNNAAWL